MTPNAVCLVGQVVSVLSDMILRVIPWGPDEQVRGVHAGRIVAVMADVHPGRYGAIAFLCHDAVRVIQFVLVAKRAVSRLGSRASPIPAIVSHAFAPVSARAVSRIMSSMLKMG